MTETFKKIELIITTIAAIITLIAIFTIHTQERETSYVEAANKVFLSLPTSKPNPPTLEAHSPTWQTITVQRGDSLQRIFTKLNIPQHDLWTLLQQHHAKLPLLTPGSKLKFLLDKQNHLSALQFPLSASKRLVFNKVNDSFKQSELTLPMTTKLAFKSGKISYSLLEAMHKAGINNRLAHQFISIFQSKVDFKRDIHPGDSFSILYKEYYIDNQKHHTGEITAAEFKTRNNTYHAINFTYPKNHNNYYTPTGESLAHRFLSYPVKFKRISSHFSYTRVDPIVHRRQPHLGIDFAANRGTPIKSIGNGRIIFIGHDRGYGNAIKIRYDRHYSALYAHMRHFAKNLKIHQYIHRGQVIGYVGSTGWSTGPHLHFGFYINGVAHDWLKLKPPYEAPIPKHYQKKFKENVKVLMATLSLYQSAMLADNASLNSKKALTD